LSLARVGLSIAVRKIHSTADSTESGLVHLTKVLFTAINPSVTGFIADPLKQPR